jgi:hypothetical protein
MTTLRILYVHSIRGKPPEPEYHAEWDAALRRSGYISDIETRMMYWADIRDHLTPEVLREAKQDARTNHTRPFARMRPQTNSPLGYVISFVLHLLDPVIRHVTKNLLEDVYFYFYGKRAAEQVRAAILDRIGPALDDFHPQIVIAHSWGSVIAYDYLTHREYTGELDALISVGSPLGNDWIQEQLGTTVYPQQVRRWLNIFDAMDPATWPDRRISNDLPGPHGEHLIRDVEIPSVYDEDGKRDAHSWFGYLMCEPLQNELFRIATARNLGELSADAQDIA